MELWDAYNADATRAGVDLVRGEPIPQGLYHAVAEVVVRHRDGQFLLVRRDLNKPSSPGLWEPGASGGVLKGETFAMGAKRELKEETGITAVQLEPMYRVLDHEKQTLYVGFLHTTGIMKDEIVLQEGETIEYQWMNRKEFLQFAASDQFVPALRSRLSSYLSMV